MGASSRRSCAGSVAGTRCRGPVPDQPSVTCRERARSGERRLRRWRGLPASPTGPSDAVLPASIVRVESRAELFPPNRPPSGRQTATAIAIPNNLMLQARQLTKEYQSGDHRLAVLRDVNFTIPDGAFVAIVGPSGSGKTTLLGLLAGLDVPSRGSVLLDGKRPHQAHRGSARPAPWSESWIRVPELSTHPHAHRARERTGSPRASRRRRGARPRPRSAGARRARRPRCTTFRTSSRAASSSVSPSPAPSATRRDLLFADEPTGNLDSETGARIVELLETLNRESGHDDRARHARPRLARRAQRIIRLADGAVVSDAPAGRLCRMRRSTRRPPQ